MPQNVYDDPAFFAAYGALPRSVQGLEGAPEWPAMRALLPDLSGRRVLDLGCGYGWFCRWARTQGGATEVLGIDRSARMLARAQEFPADLGITYRQDDLAGCDLPAARFGLAYSSLVLHYLADPAPLLARVHRSLRAGSSARLVLSTEHPVLTAPARPAWAEDPDGSGRRIWPLEGYAKEGPRVTDWLAPGVLKYHRTLGTTLNLLIEAGFRIARVVEFSPSAAQIAAQPALAEERERPTFLLLAAERD